MNENDKPTNVTPLFGRHNPAVPEHLAGMMLGKPYTTASQAVKDLLDSQDFNTACQTGGWVELKIVARFEKQGAMFSTLEMSHVRLNTQAEVQERAAGDRVTAVVRALFEKTLTEYPDGRPATPEQAWKEMQDAANAGNSDAKEYIHDLYTTAHLVIATLDKHP